MSEKRLRVSRRDVLKGAASAAAILSTPSIIHAQDTEGSKLPKGVKRIGPGATEITLGLNGKQTKLSVEPRVTLLDALRDRKGLTGTKRVCDRGACGACTVWVDGQTVNACMLLAVDADGSKVTTIEGLEQDGKLHPVQEKFIECDALMCGFCTPGMVMTCAKLVEGKPSDEELRAGLSGNLCRCGTYPHIFQACREVLK